MDEVDAPQTPEELLVILALVAEEGIPAQTIAPRFSGRFAKGVDYAGDVERFARELDRCLCVIRFARTELGLPESLKLSVHSGSDKFSLYGPIHHALRRHDAGLHLKTAGTTWLEELIGLSEGGDDGLVDRQGDLRPGARARRRAVQAVCDGARHQSFRAAAGRGRRALGWRGVRERLRHDPVAARVQPAPAPAPARGLQAGSRDGAAVLRGSRAARGGDRPQRHREPLRAPHQARLPGRVAWSISRRRRARGDRPAAGRRAARRDARADGAAPPRAAPAAGRDPHALRGRRADCHAPRAAPRGGPTSRSCPRSGRTRR